jgi:hypothetical protein
MVNDQRGEHMRRKTSRFSQYTSPADDPLERFFLQAKAQFGDAIQSYWFYDGDRCPACTQGSVGGIKVKGKNALSLNAFIYRERGVLIGYFLCETCARRIFRDAQKNPYNQTSIHAAIERNLISAYLAYIEKLDA